MGLCCSKGKGVNAVSPVTSSSAAPSNANNNNNNAIVSNTQGFDHVSRDVETTSAIPVTKATSLQSSLVVFHEKSGDSVGTDSKQHSLENVRTASLQNNHQPTTDQQQQQQQQQYQQQQIPPNVPSAHESVSSFANPSLHSLKDLAKIEKVVTSSQEHSFTIPLTENGELQDGEFQAKLENAIQKKQESSFEKDEIQKKQESSLAHDQTTDPQTLNVDGEKKDTSESQDDGLAFRKTLHGPSNNISWNNNPSENVRSHREAEKGSTSNMTEPSEDQDNSEVHQKRPHDMKIKRCQSMPSKVKTKTNDDSADGTGVDSSKVSMNVKAPANSVKASESTISGSAHIRAPANSTNMLDGGESSESNFINVNSSGATPNNNNSINFQASDMVIHEALPEISENSHSQNQLVNVSEGLKGAESNVSVKQIPSVGASRTASAISVNVKLENGQESAEKLPLSESKSNFKAASINSIQQQTTGSLASLKNQNSQESRRTSSIHAVPMNASESGSKKSLVNISTAEIKRVQDIPTQTAIINQESKAGSSNASKGSLEKSGGKISNSSSRQSLSKAGAQVSSGSKASLSALETTVKKSSSQISIARKSASKQSLSKLSQKAASTASLRNSKSGEIVQKPQEGSKETQHGSKLQSSVEAVEERHQDEQQEIVGEAISESNLQQRGTKKSPSSSKHSLKLIEN